MVLVVVFGAALLIAVLLSGLAARTVLSTSLLFLLGGALVSDGFVGLIHITPDSEIVSVTADLALFAVLFTDGMHVSFAKLRANWRNPARALGLGMPLAFVGMALITHYLVGLDWTTSFLVGAVLAPTDPVFASAIVGRKEVPARLRELLNVESGINDGLALPVVLILIAAAGPSSPHAEASLGMIGLELGLGLVFGVLMPLIVSGLVRFRMLGAEPKLQPLLPLAIGVILYAACHLTHANPYLAAFSAGAVLAAVSPESQKAFEPLGESLAELAKFAALLVFGALLTPQLFGDLSLGGYVAVILAIVLIRPASLLLSLLGTRIDRREKLVAAWFGPKGFASVVYGLLVLQAGIPQGQEAYTLIAVCIAFSIIAHSSTDVPIARLFHVDDLVEAGGAGTKTRATITTTEAMHARDLARRCASVAADESVLRAAELLAGDEALALLVVTREGHPIAFVEGHHLLAGMLPDSVREDPLRAAVLAGRLDGEVRQNMAALTVADVLPRRRPALALVSPHASPLQMAAVMARNGSPVVAVVEYDGDGRPSLLGTVTAAALLACFR